MPTQVLSMDNVEIPVMWSFECFICFMHELLRVIAELLFNDLQTLFVRYCTKWKLCFAIFVYTGVYYEWFG